MGRRVGPAVVAVLVLALPGCKVDSVVPLGPASEGVIEPRLVGAWTCSGSDDGAEPGTLVFSQFDDTQYLVRAEGGEGEEPSHLRAYSSTLSDTTFLNMQELGESGDDGERGWRFMEYSFADDGSVRLRLVAADVFEGHEDSIASARQALEGALGDPETLIDALRCMRRQAP
jgi:hypothetical protein